MYRVRSAPESRWKSLVLPRHISAANRLDHWVLRDISFDVPRGRRLGLIGENGSGKSTLLKIIAQLIRPTAGDVAVHGSVLPLLELGAGFHPDLTGWENVFLQGSILGLPRDEIRRRLGDIVEFSGLGEFMDSPVKYYSSGMFVRLAFSVAIHCAPDILLVDEILAVGDTEFQEKSFHKMMEFVGQGRTLVLVSHSLYAVREICDEVIWLDEGRIRARGPGREVIEDYMQWSNDRLKPFEQSRIEMLAPGLPAPPVVPACRIAAVRFVDGAGRPCERARSKSPLAIELECDAAEAIADVGCRVVFKSKRDTPILELDSISQGTVLALPRGKSTVRIAVESLVAKQATYDVELVLLYKPAGHSAAPLSRAQSRLDVLNPDGAETNFFLETDWRFELQPLHPAAK